jgi:hypothetical protein
MSATISLTPCFFHASAFVRASAAPRKALSSFATINQSPDRRDATSSPPAGRSSSGTAPETPGSSKTRVSSRPFIIAAPRMTLS